MPKVFVMVFPPEILTSSSFTFISQKSQEVNIPESAKYTVFLEDFVLLDDVSDKAKRIVGEVSKEEIAKLLDGVWM